MSSREMMKERATAGRGALSAWLYMEMQSEHGGGEMQNLCDT